MGIRPRGQRELGRDQELEEAEVDPQEPAGAPSRRLRVTRFHMTIVPYAAKS